MSCLSASSGAVNRRSSLPSDTIGTPTTSVLHSPRNLTTTVMAASGGAYVNIDANLCPTCRKKSNKPMGEMVGCGYCGQWAHYGCEGLTADEYECAVHQYV